MSGMRFGFSVVAFAFLTFATVIAVADATGPAGTKAPAGTLVPGGTLVPRDVYVGDAAEFSFEVTLTEQALDVDETIEIDPDLLSPSRDVTVSRVTVTGRDGRAEVRIRFVPWVSGVLALPGIPVRKETVTPPSPVIATLVRDPATGLQDARSPLLVPGTSWILYGFLACAIALLLAASFVVSRIRRYAASDPATRNSARRRREFLRDLSALSRRTGKLAQVEWYALFSACLRRYLGLYAFSNARVSRALTGSELSEIVERRSERADEANKTDGKDEAKRAGAMVRALFDGADRVRFSGRECGDGRSRDVGLARELCRILEEDERHALP